MYAEWWVKQVAVPSDGGLADHAELLLNVDARRFVGDIEIPILILAPTKSRMAPLNRQDSQRELQEGVNVSKLVRVDGADHEIYVDRAEECQKALLEFLSTLR